MKLSYLTSSVLVALGALACSSNGRALVASRAPLSPAESRTGEPSRAAATPEDDGGLRPGGATDEDPSRLSGDDLDTSGDIDDEPADAGVQAAPVRLEGDDGGLRAAPVRLEGDDGGLRAAPVRLEGDDGGLRAAPVRLEGDDGGLRVLRGLSTGDAGVPARSSVAQSHEGVQAPPDNSGAQQGETPTRKDVDLALQPGEEKALDTTPAKRAPKESAKESLAALSRLGVVTKEQRGLVVTLSEGVLFATAEYALLPAARLRLDQLAKALLVKSARNLVVEGHTDSRGSEKFNVDLSQRRADAVRAYLIVRGYDASRIQAFGIGKDRPLATNRTPKGRERNRRVELILQPVARR